MRGIIFVVAGSLSIQANEPRWEDPAGWPLHVIDASSRGADGTRLEDVNGDGRLDVATGWEEGGVTRVYLQPEPAQVREPWPQVTVGRTASVEDAVLADLDGDGPWDVVSCSEGKARVVQVHWAPEAAEDFLKAGAWRQAAFPVEVLPSQMWMFAAPGQIDGQHGVDFFVGSKGGPGRAVVGWMQAPEPGRVRDLAAWCWHPLRPASWVMGLEARDMDGDGDLDAVVSERFHGERGGCFWLENPSSMDAPWVEHAIGVMGKDALFFCQADIDQDGLLDVCVGTQTAKGTQGTEGLYWLRRLDASGQRWEERRVEIGVPVGEFKAVSAGDIDLDGRMDLVLDFNYASAEKPAVIWLQQRGDPMQPDWRALPLSGPKGGVKTDLCPLLDLDGDGDLDVMTCEEKKNLGVIWYENPAR